MQSKNIKPSKSRSKILISDARDFAPGLLSIQESPPSKMPRTVLYVVMILFVILLLWAIYGKLDIIASAEGKLIPRSYVQVVQPAEAGIVKEILVREGEKVKVGQVLVRMDPIEANADQATIESELAVRSLQIRRIDSELSRSTLKKMPDDPDELFIHTENQYKDRRQAYDDALANAQQGYVKAQRDYDSGIQVLKKLEQTNPILKNQAEAYSALGQEGYAPQTMIGDKQRAYLENLQDLHAQQSTVASLAAAVAEAAKNVGEVTSKYRSDLQNERMTAEGDFLKLAQEKLKQTRKSSLLELKAPSSGIVKDLSTHTIGTVISAGTVLLSLVPENEPLVAEVMVRNDDVGFVFPDQKVKIKLAAYPFQKYGMIDGQVLQIWPDSSDDDSQSQRSSEKKSSPDGTNNPSVYRALVSLNTQELSFSGDHLKLVPGMQVTAEIIQGHRSVFEYVLSPVQKTLSESGRER